MHVNVRKCGDVVILGLEGKLIAGVTGDELLRGALDELVGEGWQRILLDMSKVSSIDSSGVGEIVSGYRLAKKLGASLKILHPAERVRSALHLAQLLPLLEVFDDEARAVASFAPSDPVH
jgi:anti-sigma B factor antagonist